MIPQPLTYIPQWVTGKSVLFFFISLVACTFAYPDYPMEFRLAVIASLSVLLFFFGGQQMTRAWRFSSEKVFIKNVFWIGLVVHLIWVAYCYFYYNPEHYGTAYGDRADVDWYMPFGHDIAQWILNGFPISINELRLQHHGMVDDLGYPFWLAIIYLVTGTWGDFGETFIPMIIKCIVSTYSAILIYRIAQRHYGEAIARIACVFVALNPNMIYWCGCMFKEAEFVFICCAFVNSMDKALSSHENLTFKALLPASLLGLALFIFRPAVGLVGFAAVFAQVVMVSNRIMSAGKKVIAGVLVAIVLVVGMGDGLRERVLDTIETVQSDQQELDMRHRSKMKGGNSFAQYASAAIFAPLIFTIPFPTMNEASSVQVLQMMLSGGSYIKNILSFFVIFAMFVMLFSGEWRRHVFIIAYTCGYLVCLILSTFAQSGRFHMPIMPMLMMFGAYGIALVQQRKVWKQMFVLIPIAEVGICLVWNYFKLKGRGLI